MARLSVKNTYSPGARSYNVFADLPGKDHPEKVILIGAHYDGHDISPGAMDDAAGACVVLEVARALAKHVGSPKRTIRFCCFAAEEVGLNGSSGYVLNHAGDMKNVELMINADAAGISGKTGHGFMVCGTEELVTYLDKTLDDIGAFDRNKELPRVTQSIRPYSDHWPFYMSGVPTAHFRDVPPDPIDRLYSHTSADTVDKVDPKGMNDAAVILALASIRITSESNIPIRHTPIEKIVDILEKKEIAENLRIEKRWRRESPS
jgi:Zn-dependent M28 family amino/carboxypeptidase